MHATLRERVAGYTGGWRRETPSRRVLRALTAWDIAEFRQIANTNTPALDLALPALSRAADYSVLWIGVSAALYASKRRPPRRAARRGLISLGVASLLVNTVGKRVLPRDRPPLGAVPPARRAIRRPVSGSFPSGHTASAAAYTIAASHAYPVLTAPLTALAAAVAYSRIYTGVHYPSDVLAGAAIGTAVGLVTNRLAPLRTFQPVRLLDTLTASQPRRPEGAGVVMVVNPRAGGGNAGRVADAVHRQLSEVEILPLPEGGDLVDTLREAASRAEVLGICGGDGSVSAAARVAVESGLPLLVAPGGTFNHFAADLGINQAGDAVRAVREGTAIRSDVGVISHLHAEADASLGAEDTEGAPTREGSHPRHVFVNTASLGSYPRFVAMRQRLEPRLGKNLAAVVAIWRTARTEKPVRAVLNGRDACLAMVFIGNGRYQPRGFVPAWRPRLDDGILDLRVVEARGRFPALRLAASLMTGRLGHSRLYTELGSAGFEVHLPDGPTGLAWDGEIGPGSADLHFKVARLAMTVYSARPQR